MLNSKLLCNVEHDFIVNVLTTAFNVTVEAERWTVRDMARIYHRFASVCLPYESISLIGRDLAYTEMRDRGAGGLASGFCSGLFSALISLPLFKANTAA